MTIVCMLCVCVRPGCAGFAGIEFHTLEDAQRAKEEVHGTKVGDNVVECRMAESADAKWFVKVNERTHV